MKRVGTMSNEEILDVLYKDIEDNLQIMEELEKRISDLEKKQGVFQEHPDRSEIDEITHWINKKAYRRDKLQ